jgi:hypothetical protein
MCSAPKVKAPKVEAPDIPVPAPAPPPPADAPVAPALNEGARRTASQAEDLKAKRKGTRGLRIDLQIGGAGNGTGLNVPRA